MGRPKQALKYTFLDPNRNRETVARALRQMILEKLSAELVQRGDAHR